MLKKAYVEITNICNLNCSFCHGTSRTPKVMSRDEFLHVATELKGHTEYLYFHIMGEPLTHPALAELLETARSLGFRVIITTNGTLLHRRGELLLSSGALHKVSVSLHSYEANTLTSLSLDEYLDDCFSFCKEASEAGIISVMRLWNGGGEDSMNALMIERMRQYFGDGWSNTHGGFKIADRLYLEFGDKFEWPDESAASFSEEHSCYGLRDQVGILSDGRVVPCCLDADGVITLGNIFEESLSDILAKPRAVALRRSFETRRIKEPLCQRCDFAIRRVK